MPKPVKIVLALVACPPSLASSALALSDAASIDSCDAPALSTSAHAVPSGYFSNPCCATMSARRSGIIIRMPNNPPRTATSITRVNSRSNPRIKIAGMVTPTPKAIDSPADPAVCTMLFSRIVASRIPNFERMRKSVMEMTATGIDALTVNPTLRTRYNDDAPKIAPRIVPMITGRTVSSRSSVAAGMYGSKVTGGTISTSGWTMSGYSCGPTETLMRSSLCTGRAILGRKARYDHVKVKTVFAVIVLAVLSAGETAGRLFVHIAPGFEVLVDGVSAGVTTADVGGKIVNLVPGTHH